VRTVKVKVKREHLWVKLPQLGSSGAACYDVASIDRYILYPGQTAMIGTGLAFEVPKGYEIEIRPRSSLASTGLLIVNSPGTLDSDYRGQLIISVRNISAQVITVNKGDRIAQIKVNRVIPVMFEAVDFLAETERGSGGFGSTGK